VRKCGGIRAAIKKLSQPTDEEVVLADDGKKSSISKEIEQGEKEGVVEEEDDDITQAPFRSI
jgi:hypothetical protein